MLPTPVHFDWDAPQVETDATRRIGFWRRTNPRIFSDARGVGPIIVLPDTNVLIDLYENLDEIDGGAFLGPPIQGGPWPSAVDALRDLLQVWWWRDVRFLAGPWHLRDQRKPPPPARAAALRTAVSVWENDFFLRSSHNVDGEPGHEIDEPRCPAHPDRRLPRYNVPPAGGTPRLPSAALDRAMVRAALSEDCDVLLTSDRRVLKLHPALMGHGLSVHSPQSLLEALEDAGELAPVRREIAPDLGGLSTLYGMRSEEEFDGEGRPREGR